MYNQHLGVGIVVAGGGDTSLKIKSQMTTSGMMNTTHTFPGCKGVRPRALGVGIVVAGGQGHLFEGQITNDNIWHDQHYLYFSRCRDCSCRV